MIRYTFVRVYTETTGNYFKRVIQCEERISCKTTKDVNDLIQCLNEEESNLSYVIDNVNGTHNSLNKFKR